MIENLAESIDADLTLLGIAIEGGQPTDALISDQPERIGRRARAIAALHRQAEARRKAAG